MEKSITVPLKRTYRLCTKKTKQQKTTINYNKTHKKERKPNEKQTKTQKHITKIIPCSIINEILNPGFKAELSILKIISSSEKTNKKPSLYLKTNNLASLLVLPTNFIQVSY